MSSPCRVSRWDVVVFWRLFIPLLVEGLYCKRPIQCLASSKILTPHSLTARRVCTPRLWCSERTQLLGGEGVGGQYFGHCSVLYICKYFVLSSLPPLLHQLFTPLSAMASRVVLAFLQFYNAHLPPPHIQRRQNGILQRNKTVIRKK